VIEIIALIVRKDMSLSRPQIYCIINESERFPAIPPGTEEGITLTPPLNLLAIEAATELTYGGIEACCLVLNGIKQSNSLDLN
jgi:hypothetical protein